MRMIPFFIGLSVLGAYSTGGLSATCSCAGVPLADSIQQSGLPEDAWQLELNYNFRDISELVEGSTEINDETGRLRETTTYTAQLAHGLNDQWTITALNSYVEHVRNIAISNTADKQSTGLGDTLLAATYTPLRITPFSRNEIALGVGRKFATGVDDNRQNGILLIEDMQPGTGAPATLAWVYYARSFSPAANHLLFSSFSYTANEENDRDYRFGDETNFTVGYNYQSASPWAYGATLNYRRADDHQRLGFDVPNTGGEWLDLGVTVQYGFTENLAARLGTQLPVHRDLNGALQFTTKYSVSLGIAYQW